MFPLRASRSVYACGCFQGLGIRLIIWVRSDILPSQSTTKGKYGRHAIAVDSLRDVIYKMIELGFWESKTSSLLSLLGCEYLDSYDAYAYAVGLAACSSGLRTHIHLGTNETRLDRFKSDITC